MKLARNVSPKMSLADKSKFLVDKTQKLADKCQLEHKTK